MSRTFPLTASPVRITTSPGKVTLRSTVPFWRGADAAYCSGLDHSIDVGRCLVVWAMGPAAAGCITVTQSAERA